jgi:putative membrane-bound dehydrogenase-like protein
MLRKSFLVAVILSFYGVLWAADAPPVGVKPLGKDGKPLNVDFEDGTLKDWTATGDAFEGQPIQGDTVHPRRPDMTTRHEGQYWIGTYERKGDDLTGTLTSETFKITHPWASFLAAGGPHPTTKVELFLKDGTKDKVVQTYIGHEAEDLERVVVNLEKYRGQEMFIRITDNQKGHWGHVNFDDFRFYDSEPKFPQDLLAKKKQPELAVDQVKFAGLPPEQAAKEMTLPEGFTAKLFAGEPDVKQPIAFALDDRGRVWVAEAYTYPQRAPEGQGKDRILVLEDTNGDGKFDKRTVFMEGLNLVSGLEVGFGGVWVGAAPYLMFIPIEDGDTPKPAGKPQILLDGWAYQDTHETLNTFTWGPDGWLYGCHGVFTQSKVGKPGASETERQRLNAGIWRYHPVKHQFELFAEGTSNPWGVDFDENGQCIIEACVIPHLFHMIQGGRYERQAGQHFNPYTYDDIKTIADHRHYLGSKGPHAANGRSDSAGGGHAHAGLMVYLGDNWPDKYRGQFFMNNIHGQRINQDSPEHKGSGFVGHHAPDFINFNDRWSQILNFTYDQDGAVFMIDWYDQNQCHRSEQNAHDRSNGRIFKIAYGDKKATKVDLQKLTSEELVLFQLHKNDWYVRHARRILEERGANTKAQEYILFLLNLDNKRMSLTLPQWALDPASASRQLRLLQALHVTGGLTEEAAAKTLRSPHEYVRAWTIQLMLENKEASEAFLQQMARLAKEDPSPVVRLYLASGLQRVPIDKRTPVLEGLFSHAEDAGDHNLPLMYWYAAEPVAGQSPAKAVSLLSKSKIPLLRQYITRRMTATGQKKTASLKSPNS